MRGRGTESCWGDSRRKGQVPWDQPELVEPFSIILP